MVDLEVSTLSSAAVVVAAIMVDIMLVKCQHCHLLQLLMTLNGQQSILSNDEYILA